MVTGSLDVVMVTGSLDVVTERRQVLLLLLLLLLNSLFLMCRHEAARSIRGSTGT